MFQHKPDGDVTFMTFQDAQSIPISTFQDPLHYPHNTKFLAPGTAPCHAGIAKRCRTTGRICCCEHTSEKSRHVLM